jgi:hypothetical protein
MDSEVLSSRMQEVLMPETPSGIRIHLRTARSILTVAEMVHLLEEREERLAGEVLSPMSL